MTSPRLPTRFADRLLGREIGGQYRIDAKIGEGGMGAVYRGIQLAVQRPVAIKVLRPHVPEQDKPALIERFRREALATSRLRHPNTVSVYDFGETDDGVLYMVLELLEGKPLSTVIRESAPIPAERVAAIGRQVAKSLAEAHACGIVHRDLKPDNIFVCDYHGDPDFTKVMDFGIARLVTGDSGQDVTRTGMMIGTPKYIAPEQAMAKRVTPAADLYALGVILFEMITGRPPFEADSPMALALAHIHEPVPQLALRDLPPPLATAWQGLIGALLAKNPRDRPQEAGQVAVWLDQLERDARRHRERRATGTWTGSVAAVGEAPSTYEGPSPRRTVTVSRPRGAVGGGLGIALAALLFMALGGAVAYLLVSRAGPAAAPAVVAAELPPREAAPPAAVTAVPAAPPAAEVAPPAVSAPTAVVDLDEMAFGSPEPAPAPAAPEPGAPAELLPGATLPPPQAVVFKAPEPVHRAPVRLLLASDPAGASVRLGAHTICTTPCDVSLAPDDERQALLVRLRGYADALVDVDLAAGATVTRAVSLRRVRPPAPAAASRKAAPTVPALPALRVEGH